MIPDIPQQIQIAPTRQLEEQLEQHLAAIRDERTHEAAREAICETAAHVAWELARRDVAAQLLFGTCRDPIGPARTNRWETAA